MAQHHPLRLKTNDPWLPDLVPRAEAGEQIIDSIDFSLAPKPTSHPQVTARNVVKILDKIRGGMKMIQQIIENT